MAKENYSKQGISDWEEREVFAKTEVFGKIAQRFSTYQIRFTAKGKETVRRGINAIQLIQQGVKWYITSLAWDRQSETLPIPTRYLPD
jgi:hypothetical protein